MTRLRTAGPAVALVVALAAFATACGGGGRLSAREYVREASHICRHANRRMQWADHMSQKAEVQAAAADALAGLHPPESLARFDAAWVGLARQSAAEFDALVVALRAGDHAGAARRRDAVAVLTARAAEMARARGIAACPVAFAPAESRV